MTRSVYILQLRLCGKLPRDCHMRKAANTYIRSYPTLRDALEAKIKLDAIPQRHYVELSRLIA